MSFSDADDLIRAVMERIPDHNVDGGQPPNMDQLFAQMMDVAMDEMYKASQTNANLRPQDFDAGYDATLAGIDTTGNPVLAKAIADYRAARTPEERDALKATLAGALESSAQEAERNVFSMLGGAAAGEAEDAKPMQCGHMGCNCDNSNAPFNRLLHDLTDDGYKRALAYYESTLTKGFEPDDNAVFAAVKPISDRNRLELLRAYIKQNQLSIDDIVSKFIAEGCRGFSWQFLMELPEFSAEIPKYYKCRSPAACLVCTCCINNRGFIADIRHPNFVFVEHYPSIMTQELENAIKNKNFTNMNVFYEHFKGMQNFAHYHQVFKQSLGDISKLHKYAQRWLKSH